MTLTQFLGLLGPLDLFALALCLVGWLAMGWLIEHPPAGRVSVTLMVADYRREWMRQFIHRDNRIFDATLVASLRQSTTYFASTSLLAVGAVLALIGNTAPLQLVAEGFTAQHGPAMLWQLRLLPPVLFLTHAFLKFVWSNRMFGYCSVMMGAVPSDPRDPRAPIFAARAAELNVRAALNFNRGLRSVYFALGALGWILGPVALIVTSAAVTWTLWYRDFASHAHKLLSEPLPPDARPDAIGPENCLPPEPR